MRTRPGLAWFLAGLLLVGTGSTQENPVAEAQVHQREANQAYQAGDYDAFTRSLEIALGLNPSSFATRYNLACGYARTGRSDDALELLRGLTAARVDFGMARDPDLASLRELPEFQALVAELEANIAPIINSTEHFRVEQLGLIPEGIAHDPATGRLFFGSMRTGDVMVLDGDGLLSKFATVGAGSGRAAIGMTVDSDRGLLWVIGTSFFMAENFDADAATRSGVYGFDLTSGELEHDYLIAEGGLGLNDVALGPNGELYASGQELHVLDPTTDTLVPLQTVPAMFGSNGITAHPDGNTLIFSSYPVGLGTIDLKSRAMRFMVTPEDVSLYGIDGLYWHDGDLVAIQNGIQPWRLLRLSVDADLTAITDVRTIEFANDAATPTTGAIVGDRIHYVGQAPTPETLPSQYPESLAPYIGQTVIRTAPLDR